MHINYRQLNLLTEWENGKWERGRKGGRVTHGRVSNQHFLQGVVHHWFREMLRETLFQDQIFTSRNHCLLYLLCEYIYLHINILVSFEKIFSNISAQSSQILLNVDLLQCQLCPIELSFCKACWEMLAPHLPSHCWGKGLVVGREREVRLKGIYR